MPARKILYIIGSLDLGGAERHLSLITPRLKKLGWQPLIYCISRRGVQSAEVERSGVTVIGPPWESRARQSRAARFLQLFASCLKMLVVLVREHPHIVHFFLPLSYVIGAPLAWIARIPILVMSRRSLNFYQAQHRHLARFEIILHRRMDAILGNSRAVFNQLVELERCDPSKVSIIYNGIDIDSIDRAAPLQGAALPQTSGLVFIIVANLIRYKGHANLIDALAGIRDRLPDQWTLLCIGRDDGIRDSLEAQARRLGLESHIQFLGERTDVEALLKRADIGILCSHEEGFANAILEGMAASLPMVATDVGGNAESVVHGETGLIVPPRDPPALGAAILELASDTALRARMSAAARRRAEERFSIDRCVSQYDALYQTLERRYADRESGHATRWARRFESLRQSTTARYAALFSVTFLTLCIALSAVDLNTVWLAAQDLSIVTVLSVGGMLLLGSLLSATRFWYMASDIGHRLSLRDAMLALSVGQIAGAITVQFFGQIAARSIVLGPHRMSPPANILLATYERFVAAAASAAFAITGAWYLFGSVALDLRTGGDDLLRIVAGLLAAITAAAAFGWGRMLLKSIPDKPSGKVVVSIIRTVVLTAAIQICTMTCYVVAAQSLSPNIAPSHLWAAAAVVTFAASLPISFAGWGVRELSAVLVLGAIGIRSGQALTISIMLGALALGALIVIAAIALLLPRRTEPSEELPAAPESRIDIIKLVQRCIPLVAASALYFQIHVPVGTALLNVNLADPVAILGGALFLYSFAIRKSAQWRLQWLGAHIVVATVVMTLAFLHGYEQFGWSDWAFNNKLLGWFVLLCYGGTGALIVASDRRDFQLLLRTFVGTAVGILVLDFTLLLVDAVVAKLPSGIIVLPLVGFSQNRNAYAFILVLAICSTFVMPPRLKPWVLGILFAGLWYTQSRAALGAMLVVFVAATALRVWQLKTVARSAAIAVAIVAVMTAVPLVMGGIAGEPAGSQLAFTLRSIPAIAPASDQDRFTSLFSGIELFFSHPIFGAGLGAYWSTAHELTRPLVIHSTPIWLLAELGLIGFLAFAIPAGRILCREWTAPERDAAGRLIILVLLVFAVMSLVHELLYQRTMWLLLGAALAYVPHHALVRTTSRA